ncbi:Trans-aconitate 2-methyltransferase [Pirellula sp. SH-Sr6A]|uniref:class I SAM-dependent methyltransferase n=1 Tax=Pirellula sp. SH-Sr6A TaxID=1632865 RepID=UPI00078E39C0|nr:class I SAM-dependent methyltransferase [Pirellula sp. SH-Sr6A]AMV35530.1 Trans-aconitate 2-methyltransferase [Pirellula sp. SH-Sr6A]
MEKAQHWENVYQTKKPTQVSWYEAEPNVSMNLILQSAGTTRGRIIDIGGGQSLLVDRLLDAGFQHVTVLDISPTAISATKSRLGEQAKKVNWMVADITAVKSLGEFDIWHDRAVLHFLTDAEDQLLYVDLLKRTLAPRGYFIVGAFAKGGPEKCSGLPVQQVDEQSMQELLGSDFRLVQSLLHLHTTPTSNPQHFYYGVFQRI